MIYNINYFIKKFTAIPEELWTIGVYTSGYRHCALGHCGVGIAHLETKESLALDEILEYEVAGINDGTSCFYKGPTPKERILGALREKQKQRL